MANSLSMYSVTENSYYSQLSSVAILLQPEPVSHRIIQGKVCVLSPSVLSSWGISLPPTCLLLTVKEARSYFASALLACLSVSVNVCQTTRCYISEDTHLHENFSYYQWIPSLHNNKDLGNMYIIIVCLLCSLKDVRCKMHTFLNRWKTGVETL
jgi:hypothetical protein